MASARLIAGKLPAVSAAKHSNRLAVPLGPLLFGLPYHFGRLEFRDEGGIIEGNVTGPTTSRRLSYRAKIDAPLDVGPCLPNSRDEFLIERYAAFTSRESRQRFFRVWHEPWPQSPIPLSVADDTLLLETGDWPRHARFIGASYSPGVHDVWMGRPQNVPGTRAARPQIS